MILEICFYLFLAYAYGSFMEWFAHKHLMHGRSLQFPSIPKDHAAHHKAYYAAFVEADKPDEKNLALCFEHVIIGTLPGLLLSLFISLKLTFFLALLGGSYYFLFDRLHSAQHLEATWLPGPWKRAMVFHHFLHHQHPHKNFGVVFFLADWIMGTVATPTYTDKRKWVAINSYMKNNKEVPFGDRKPGKCFLTHHYMDNGYVGPAPQGTIGLRAATILLKLFIGDCIFVNGELPQGGPYVYAISHNSWADILAIQGVVPGIRLMAAKSVMNFCGLGFLLGPFLGCWAAEGDGKGTAVKAGIEILQSGQPVGICPEGWAYIDQFTRPFKSGVCRIAQGGKAQIVPIYIEYYNYRSERFLKLPLVLQIILDALDFRKARMYSVSIGEPLPPDSTVAMVEYKVKQLGGHYGY